MKHLYRATKIISDIEIEQSYLSPKKVKEFIKRDMVERFAVEMSKHLTVTETRNDKLEQTRLDYSLVMMSEQEYKDMLAELVELRGKVELVSAMAKVITNGEK